MEFHLLLVLLFPLLGALLNTFFGTLIRRFVPALATLALFLSFVFSLILIKDVASVGAFTHTFSRWIDAGPLIAPFALRADELSSFMALVVTLVSFLVHLYSIGYMKDHEGNPDPGIRRYFIYLNLFVFSMLLLVLAENFLLLFIGWEGVGLCSYLLIGYEHHREAARDAGLKAFVVNRIGDVSFIIGIFLLFIYFDALDFTTLETKLSSLDPSSPGLALFGSLTILDLIALLLFGGAIGKSAQFPLYVWLPDAMEGPTPVSALIHAATMVTAGVYLVARTFFLFELSPDIALPFVAIIGCFTAFYAATMALTHNDMKRILAYSTVSQLGYMFLGVGVGAYSAGISHLMTHAFFKALLFLGAGAVMHSIGLLDIRRMGRLKTPLAFTALAMLVGTFAIAGVPGLSGFFSKDYVIGSAFAQGTPLGFGLGVLALITSFLTAFYMFRMFSLAFLGDQSRLPSDVHVHKNPRSMNLPLIFLGLGSIAVGWFVGPHSLLSPSVDQFLGKAIPVSKSPLPHIVEYASIFLSFLGIGSAWFIYTRRQKIAAFFQKIPLLYRLSSRLYYVDEIYDVLFVAPLRFISLAFWRIFDDGVIDKGTDLLGRSQKRVGGILRKIATGNVLDYLALMLVFILVTLLAGLFSEGVL